MEREVRGITLFSVFGGVCFSAKKLFQKGKRKWE